MTKRIPIPRLPKEAQNPYYDAIFSQREFMYKARMAGQPVEHLQVFQRHFSHSALPCLPQPFDKKKMVEPK